MLLACATACPDSRAVHWSCPKEILLAADLRTSALEPLSAVADPSRVAVLERVGELGRDGDPALDRVARLAAGLLSAPAAYVTLVGPQEHLAPGAVEVDHDGEPTRTLPLRDSICQFQVVTGEPLVIEDTRRDKLTEHNRIVLDGTVGAYAGMPLRTSDGHVLGSLCVVDRAPRAWEQACLSLLEDLAVVVSHDIQNRLAGERNAELQRAARSVLEQAPAHAHAVAALVELAELADDPQLQRSAARARASSQRLTAETSRLARVSGVLSADAQAGSRSVLDLRRVVERAVAGARQATGTSDITLDLPGTALPIVCDPVRLELALVHLFVSALHHTSGGRPLAVKLSGGHPTATEGRGRSELLLSAPGTRVPAAELGRLVARFAGAVEACDERAVGQAALRMTAGAVHATSGPVTASSSPNGLTFRAEWVLAGGDLVIDLR